MNRKQEKKASQFIFSEIPRKLNVLECAGLHGADMAYFISRIHREHKIPVFVVVSSSGEGETLLGDLTFFLGTEAEGKILYFPPYNILPFKFLSYHNETAAKRISVLHQLISGGKTPIVITTPDVLMQKLIPKQELSDYAELVMVGEDIDRDALIRKLIAGGYSRSVIVEEPGDFCARGGILDIFSPLYPEPLRMELFGDTVDSLRFFSAATQRTFETISEAIILPAREAILKKENLTQIISRIRKQASALDIYDGKITEILGRIDNEGTCPGIESLISLIYPKLDTFFNYAADNNALFILAEPEALDTAAEAAQEKVSDNYLTAHDEGRLCVEPDALYIKWYEAKERLAQKNPLILKSLPVFAKKSNPAGNFRFSVDHNTDISMELKKNRENEHPFSLLANWINARKNSGYAAVLACGSKTGADRLFSLLQPYGILMSFAQSFSDIPLSGRRGVYVCIGQISAGFVWPDESLAIITESEIFGRGKKFPRQKQKVQTELPDFQDLKAGELVVHADHGIGRYEELVKLRLNGLSSDFLLIRYRGGDKLYLPAERMSMIQKYMGVDGFEAVLDKMGGKSWDKVKNRIKKSVEKMAGELLRLYAARKVREGHAFGAPDEYFQDFEAGFPYEETPDQFRAIENVLADMQSPTPMDRLVCGDVGYGKTEVALRASIMAVSEGKQVAVLVPTTVLAEQHFATFSGRFEDYPVNIQCLSRFRSMKEQRSIIKGIRAGTTDIAIGTHRLIQKDIEFKDLGLMVIDEEQRFGVSHKEKLKKIRSTVDVLALTATPIPRTLHMSMMGIRDISIISTPPEHRHPIITYISEFDDAVISEAIKRELDRKGQIFFVHNNIRGVKGVAAHLKKLVPNVRLDIAHGRMKEDRLETVMLRFMKKEIDLLVCTTIIESGIDVSAANTILINRADRFGLAQIYQLRGRVGRSDEQAYAYLFIPNETTLTRDAQKRLKVLMEHSDLGSGFQIAMSDLRIRGGGTILGASQSGHIAAVGYDMFLRLMKNAVSELKGEPVADDLEPEINVNMSALIPESYMPDIDQRLSAYRRLAKMRELRELSDYKAELADRFGTLPPEVTNLILKIMLKVLSVKAGVRRLDLTEYQALFYFSEAHQKKPSAIVDLIASDQKIFQLTPNHVLKAKLAKRGSSVAQLKNILKNIAGHVND